MKPALAAAALAAFLLPLAAAAPEVRDPSEAAVHVDGGSDFFEFAPGSALSTGTTWTLTAPDGRSVSLAKTNALAGGGPQRWLLSGTRAGGSQGYWTWSGDLDGAAADGTWTLQVAGAVYASDGGTSPDFGHRALLSVQGRSIEVSVASANPSTTAQAWNWHEGSWSEPEWPAGTLDPPAESPAEDPQQARLFLG